MIIIIKINEYIYDNMYAHIKRNNLQFEIIWLRCGNNNILQMR